jgi:hypothetical protein
MNPWRVRMGVLALVLAPISAALLRARPVAAEPAQGAKDGRRTEALSAVRRLGEGDSFRCTGTILRRHGGTRVALLTAAHCVFALDAAGHIGAPLSRLFAEGIDGPLAGPAIGPRFLTCAGSHETLTTCLDHGGDDIALIPLTDDEQLARVAWEECAAAPVALSLFSFGYGVRRNTRGLVGGLFQLEEKGGDLTPWSAIGQSYRVVVGDSGGPVISALEERDLGSATRPHVCFTMSAVRFRQSEDPSGSTARALLQPAWDLDARLRR